MRGLAAQLLVLCACLALLSAAGTKEGAALQAGEDRIVRQQADSANWQKILTAYVVASPDGINRFAYGRVTKSDRQKLKQYLLGLQQVKVSTLARAAQLAFWINLYNALTIDVVLDHYPVASIKDISLGGGFFATGPWKKTLVSVEGKQLSLDNIEHDILRKTWKDPRIHYAVNCASLSCPNLATTEFTPDNSEQLLEQGARGYVNHRRGVLVQGGRLVLSRIYSWYRSDFGTSNKDLIAHLNKYAGAELRKKLSGIDTIDGYDYDWSLNDAK